MVSDALDPDARRSLRTTNACEGDTNGTLFRRFLQRRNVQESLCFLIRSEEHNAVRVAHRRHSVSACLAQALLSLFLRSPHTTMARPKSVMSQNLTLS